MYLRVSEAAKRLPTTITEVSLRHLISLASSK